jgi:hypothetical protein
VAAISEYLGTFGGKFTMLLSKQFQSVPSFSALASALQSNETFTQLELLHSSEDFAAETQLLPSTCISAFSNVLLVNRCITCLEMVGIMMDLESWSVFACALECNTTITSLKLSANCLGDDGARAISSILAANSTLRSLNIHFNSIGPSGLASMFSTSVTSITRLELPHNQLGDPGAAIVAEILRRCSFLEHLDLQSNQITALGVTDIANALSNSSLKSLRLDRNAVSDDGATALASSIAGLTSLKLLGTHICDDGVHAIVSKAQQHSNLTELDLGDNALSHLGVGVICGWLRDNSTLKSFCVSSNQCEFGEIYVPPICQALFRNSTLTHLEFSHGGITNEGLWSLATLLEHSSSIRSVQFSKLVVDCQSGLEALLSAMQPNHHVLSIKFNKRLLHQRYLSIMDSIQECCRVLNNRRVHRLTLS